ncbi:succinate dehydrogenase assembly factor 2 [Candidatus Providencia siddallii]|uniref:FAD assembly factor SdhE n=1 Tax=Candidatus Providencia siddallii TaxID=1715285 RepID=A0ABP1CE78_9GAMM
MNIKNKKKIYLNCRRSMRELDFLILFFEQEYDNLFYEEKRAFYHLLKFNDHYIINFLTNYKTPKNKNLINIIKLIQTKYLHNKIIKT